MKPLELAQVPQEETEIAIRGIVNAWRRNDPAIMALMSDAATEGEVYRMAREICEDEHRNSKVYLNDIYQVSVRKAGPYVHLSIKRIDRQPVTDWRDKQEIKNQLVGPECEGVELYPAESRLVDGANQFHIFCVPDPNYRFPFGFTGPRAVTNEPIGKSQQRPRE